jgi:hypothetical protein
MGTGLAAMLRVCGGLAFDGDIWGKVMSGCGCVETGNGLERRGESSGRMRAVKWTDERSKMVKERMALKMGGE